MFDKLEAIIPDTSSLLLTCYFVNSLKDVQVIIFIYYNLRIFVVFNIYNINEVKRVRTFSRLKELIQRTRNKNYNQVLDHNSIVNDNQCKKFSLEPKAEVVSTMRIESSRTVLAKQWTSEHMKTHFKTKARNRSQTYSQSLEKKEIIKMYDPHAFNSVKMNFRSWDSSIGRILVEHAQSPEFDI